PGLAMLPLIWSHLFARQRVGLVIACVGAIASAFYLVPQSSWSRLLTIGSEMTAGTLTHRTSIWAAGFNLFREHPFVGMGAGTYGIGVARALDIVYVAHNTYLSILVVLGVVGELLFLGMLAAMFHRILQMPRLEKRF